MTKIIKGAGGGGKGGDGEGRTPVESPDSLRSIQYANVIDLLSEGEIEGLVDGSRSIFLDDTPLQNADGSFNFTGVTVQTRNGTQSQSYIPGFAAAEAENAVGIEVTQALPVVRSITNSNNTAVRVTLSVPTLTVQNTTTGDITGSSVEIAIDIQTDGGGWVAQPLRKIFQRALMAVSASGITGTTPSNEYNIDVNWTGQNVLAPQTATFQLQYRVVGDVAWIVSQTHTFSGGAFVNTGNLTSDLSNFFTGIAYARGSKTFNLTLPENTYEFRVVKTNGSLQKQGSIILGQPQIIPQVGIAYGGTVAITGGSVYAPAYTDVISGKTTSKYQRAYRIPLPIGDNWDIRVRRITADSVSSLLNNKTFWDSYTEIIDGKLTYPNSAIIATQIDAKQFSRIPVRGFEIRGIKCQIPSNYDPLIREYTGTWDGTFTVAWTNNPAWVWYDIVTNDRYGLGELITEEMVDKWALYSIAQYCDEMVEDGFGGIEPRFTCNLYLQTREQAYQVIMNIASIFRAMTYWAASTIFVSQDAPKSPTQIFTAANVIDGMFNYVGSSGRVRHTVALITWNDPQDNYLPRVEYVSDNEAISRYGIIQTNLVAIGCTSRGQAARMGRWLLYSEQYETETISFKAGIDSVFLQPGDVIQTQDPNRAGLRMGGRLVTATLSSVTLDNPITIQEGKTYELSVKMPDGTIESRAITNGIGLTSILTVDEDFPESPMQYAMWVVSVSDLTPEKWRVISMAEIEKTQIEITALAYREDKYLAVEQGLMLEPLPTSIINGGVPETPSNLTVVESLYLVGVGVVGVKATVSWNSQLGINSYILTYSKEGENPVTITTSDNSVDVQPLTEGDYTFTLYAVNSLGRRSQAQNAQVSINGKSTPPADVENFQVNSLGSIGLFTWNPATDLDVIVGGKVYFRFSPNLLSTWDTAQDLVNEAAGSATTITLPLQSGVYFAKFVDSSGNQSANATSIITNTANILALNFVEVLEGEPDWLGTKVNTAYYGDLDGLMLVSNDLWDSSELMDSDEPMDFGGGVTSAGTYALGEIDLGHVQTSRISMLVDAIGLDFLDKWDAVELVDSTEPVDGDVVNDVTALIYYRTTNDDPNLTPTWSDWQTSTLADVSARAFEFELRLTSESLYHNVLVTSATAQVDMPDRIESGDNIISGTAPYVVTYTLPFIINPALALSIENMDTGDYYELSNKDQEGFTIQFFNVGGVAISRTFDYIAKGY
jgi:predicted phage tail protein